MRRTLTIKHHSSTYPLVKSQSKMEGLHLLPKGWAFHNLRAAIKKTISDTLVRCACEGGLP